MFVFVLVNEQIGSCYDWLGNFEEQLGRDFLDSILGVTCLVGRGLGIGWGGCGGFDGGSGCWRWWCYRGRGLVLVRLGLGLKYRGIGYEGKNM